MEVESPDREPLHSHAGSDAFRAEAGSLYVVATPLGNLRDVTLRALDILASADAIAAEDTRVTATLLRRYDISTSVLTLHRHNEMRRAETVVAMLAAGKSVALVSDAGTPGISDPGARLARAVRDAGFPVVPIPGASAVAAALSVAGLEAEAFLFVGFLPSRAKARRDCLHALVSSPAALVFYEAPHRVHSTVSDLLTILGPDRTLVVARELTKIFETITRLPLGSAPAWLAADANRERGEFVLIVDAAGEKTREMEDTLSADAERWLCALLTELPPSRAARVVSTVTNVPRHAVYARALALKPEP